MDENDLRVRLQPADLEQRFAPVGIVLLWAHYWRLATWTFRDLSAPFWRIYWNDRPGAVIFSGGEALPLTPANVYLISPNTRFASRITDTPGAEKDDRLEGSLLSSRTGKGRAHAVPEDSAVRHFSLHFLLGIPYDMLAGKIYQFPLSAAEHAEIAGLIDLVAGRTGPFAVHDTLRLQAFVGRTAARIPAEDWSGLVKDPRVLSVLATIDAAQGAIPSNQELAEGLSMTTDSFIRLFRKSIGMTPHRYALIKRLAKSAILLNHTTKGIDVIAAECGFEDRNYYTRLFTRLVGLSPARYRKTTSGKSP